MSESGWIASRGDWVSEAMQFAGRVRNWGSGSDWQIGFVRLDELKMEEHFILRVPPSVAERLNRLLNEDPGSAGDDLLDLAFQGQWFQTNYSLIAEMERVLNLCRSEGSCFGMRAFFLDDLDRAPGLENIVGFSSVLFALWFSSTAGVSCSCNRSSSELIHWELLWWIWFSEDSQVFPSLSVLGLHPWGASCYDKMQSMCVGTMKRAWRVYIWGECRAISVQMRDRAHSQ